MHPRAAGKYQNVAKSICVLVCDPFPFQFSLTFNHFCFVCSNVHDYSYEAQVRKDTTFGGKINDFYDKRQTTDIAYRGYPLNQVSDADLILDGFRNEVKEKYEQFFNAGSS